MWAWTYGIDRWTPAKLVDRMTAKLVVVNLVKFHLTKLKLFNYFNCEVYNGNKWGHLYIKHPA